MEVDVIKKVKEAVKAKLLELGCHIVDDDLPQYIMVLIANNKSNQEMENDLTLFLADNTKRFVCWLAQVLKKLEEVTTASGPKKEEGKRKKAKSKSKSKEEKSKKKAKADKDSREEGEKERSRKDSEDATVPGASTRTKTKTKEEKKEEKATGKEKTDDAPVKVEETERAREPPTPEKKEVKKAFTITRDKVRTRTSSIGDEPEKVKFTRGNEVVSRDRKEREPANNARSHHPHHEDKDTLILDSGENEFENLEELRRLALESRQTIKEEKPEQNENERRSRSRTSHQRNLITNILTRVKEEELTRGPKMRRISPLRDRVKEIKRSRSRSRERETSEKRRSDSEKISRVDSRSETRGRPKLSSPSVFNRVGSQQRRSRTRSRSPAKKLSSAIGTVIRHQSPDREDPVEKKNSLSSVVKVTDRPKRDLKLSNRMLLRAFADAQQSIMKTGQNSPQPKVREVSSPYGESKRKSTEENGRTETPPKRKFTETQRKVDVILDSDSPVLKRKITIPNNNYVELAADSSTSVEQLEIVAEDSPRKSVKERLGIREQTRRSVKDRLGALEPVRREESFDLLSYENMYSPAEDYKIFVNVGDENNGMSAHQRNVMLTACESKRISIQVNNDSSDDSMDGSRSPSISPIPRDTGHPAPKGHINGLDEAADGEIQLGVSDEDKLPEVPSSPSLREDIVFEEVIEEDRGSSEHDDGDPATNPLNLSQISTATSADSNDQNFSITINKVFTSPLAPKKPPVPDLHAFKPVIPPAVHLPPPTVANGNAGIRCKFWPNCQFKDKCIFEHPRCKFTHCKNKDCLFKHDSIPEAPASTKIICKFYPKCTSMNCKFLHPSPCRFGLGCTLPRCENFHPGVTLGQQKLRSKGVKILPNANQLKWVKKA